MKQTAAFFSAGKGGAAIATTYIRPYKVAAGKTAVQTMEDRFAYGLNPKKIGAVSAYLCDPSSAPAEFLLTKSQYQAETGRAVERGALFFQIRQAFPPGEVTPEEANKIGYETAMRWTKGKYQFFVCTHIDKGHPHNHIYFNSTAQDCSRKFHNFIGSSFALRRLSDRVCIEHELSVIQNPKQHSKSRFLHYGQWIGEKPPTAQQRVRLAIVEALVKKPADFPAFLRLMDEAGFRVKHGRGGVISFLAPGQDKYTRLRASVLGPGFDPDEIRAVIAGERPIPELPKVYNLKQMAAALQYLQEHKLTDYEELAASTEAAVDRFHALAGKLRETEAALSHTVQLMGATVDFAKNRPVFDGYKAARYSKKYLAQHEAELAAYRAAKAAMNDLLGGAKLPKMDALKKERRELSEKKKALYALTAKPRQICGRPLRSRQTLITCSAIRTGGKIRPRSVSDRPPTTGACAGTSGQSVQKFSGFGELPNKHFHGPTACENFGVWPHPNCLPFCANPENGAKKRRYTLFLRILRFFSRFYRLDRGFYNF